MKLQQLQQQWLQAWPCDLHDMAELLLGFTQGCMVMRLLGSQGCLSAHVCNIVDRAYQGSLL